MGTEIVCLCGCGRPIYTQRKDRPVRFIKGHYAKFKSNPYPFATDTERFWSKVDIKGEDDCWEWGRYRLKQGYGIVRFYNKIQVAHRIAFILSGGILTEDKTFVLHRCDRPACCNPKHLFAGNQQDNMRDMANKNRSAHNRGVKSGVAKISELDVIEMRKIYNENRLTLREIGMLYGLAISQTHRICNRQAWEHVL